MRRSLGSHLFEKCISRHDVRHVHDDYSSELQEKETLQRNLTANTESKELKGAKIDRTHYAERDEEK